MPEPAQSATAAQPGPSGPSSGHRARRGPGRKPNPSGPNAPTGPNGPQHGRQDNGGNVNAETEPPRPRRTNQRRNKKPQDVAQDDSTGEAGSGRDQQPQRSRREQFGGKLTSQNAQNGPAPPKPSGAPKLQPNPQATDLTNRLALALSTPPYPDCAICFNSIHPAQPTWSCSPSSEATSCCWTSFHLKCIRAWALKRTKETRVAYESRGEDNPGEWACPGCQTKRYTVPQSYLCFCGQVNDPKPARLSTPHSCGNACIRKRRTCEHSCPLPCHPGPCPPCITTVINSCFCGRTTLSFRCAHLSTDAASPLSCGSTCNKMLSCGKHRCEEVCHEGDCKPCAELDIVPCYCGKERKQVPCGEGEPKVCAVGEDSQTIEWIGRFECDAICARPFQCGVHFCSKKCHPPSPVPIPCPKDPSSVTHCPCGKTLLGSERQKCTDPIPTCDSTCGKDLPSCKHACAAHCHLGDCPPCSIPIAVPCRCGETTRYISCAEQHKNVVEGVDILCDKICKTLRLCGKHECTRTCCPAHKLRPRPGKGKRKAQPLANASHHEDPLEDMEALWHTCEFLCGKPLTCGLHSCSEPDHRGPCPPCLRSSFEELVCRCGRTVMPPPIPCGTKIVCTYQCADPPPPCGHPRTPHQCHESGACPPCPFLTTKPCACGKQNVSNVRCSQEKVSCGKPCGKQMPCGYHLCERVCHGDDCGDCHAACGKPRKFCLPLQHPCTAPCHAPSACDETEPCQERVRATCECGRITQPALCGRSATSGARDPQKLECSTDCQIAKRNARLAEALGITPRTGPSERQMTTYSSELIQFARANARFIALVEKTFSEFVASDKTQQLLPHMQESRRTFVTSLASLYRMDTRIVDVEPNQSVQIMRRIDTRVPTPLLSQAVAPPVPTSPALGRLVNLQTPSRPASGASSPAAPGTPIPTARAASGGGWASIAATRPAAPASPAPASPASRLTALPRSGSSSSLPPRRSPAMPSWEDDV